jgi:hypothetical protein
MYSMYFGWSSLHDYSICFFILRAFSPMNWFMPKWSNLQKFYAINVVLQLTKMPLGARFAGGETVAWG